MDPDDETLIDFKIHLQEKYFIEMRNHMRKCGVKIPIAGTNWTSNPANIKTHLIMDFFDNHAYHYDWNWKEYEKHCANDSITKISRSVTRWARFRSSTLSLRMFRCRTPFRMLSRRRIVWYWRCGSWRRCLVSIWRRISMLQVRLWTTRRKWTTPTHSISSICRTTRLWSSSISSRVCSKAHSKSRSWLMFQLSR